ncbi:hypothetical protein VSS37_03370 [Candidatus Thiothrix sp. Deng01]|uniref:Holin n=1 Tax=Candidatus Thiothrix phosphatis TaxID=3112415 RepID=A0ABU6CT70_9GAMM|nr:hypothetical protein [Candidatus Thiothrix sp. Deng01]MEB4590010.1 hypothetical protein [Candidatus Thiothrix sp. Deng01]
MLTAEVSAAITRQRGYSTMQPQNGGGGWGITGFILNLIGGVMLFFEQNAGAFTVLMGLLAWLTGVIFQYRKDRREQREHEHRMKLVELKEAFKDGSERIKADENDAG